MTHHKIQKGDVFKILPFIHNDKPKYGIELNTLFNRDPLSNDIIHDTSGLLKIIYQKWLEKTKVRKNYATRYAFNIWIDNQIKVVLVQRCYVDIIMSNRPNIFDLNSNTHFIILEDPISLMERKPEDPFIEPGKTIEIENWSNNITDWFDFIKQTQPDFIGSIKENSPLNKKEILIREFGQDYLTDIFLKDELPNH
jgi:hypothetical protein